MVDIFIPSKTMQGRAINAPGNPNHGRILLKNPSGVLVPSALGRPTWISSPHAGYSVLDVAPAGFTQVPVTGDSQVIYVDPAGSDSANGLSEEAAVKTLSRAKNLQRSGYPDRILLKRGGVWREGFSGWKSGNESMSAVVGWYGDSNLPRPKIEWLATQFISGPAISNIQFHGIEWSHYEADITHPEYSPTASGGALMLLGGYHNIVFEDCKFNYVELIVQPHHETNIPPGDIYILWCLHTGRFATSTSYSQSIKRPSNVFVSGFSKLVIANSVADHGGWSEYQTGAGANKFCHNYYLNYGGSSNDLTFSDNISTRASSHGVQARPGGVVSNNFLGRNALGILLGYGLETFTTGEIGHVLDNVVTEGVNMYKGFDEEMAVCQNGVCSSAVYGIDFDLNGTLDPGAFQCKRNLVHTVDPVANAAGVAFFGGIQRKSIWYHNQAQQNINDVVDEENIAWKWASDSEGVGVNYFDPGRTLSDYYKYLNETPEDPSDRFGDFMQEVLNRPPRSRDANYESRQINAFIKQGFEILL